jgi:hypothetical protein
VSEDPGTEVLAVAPGFDDVVVDDERAVDFAVVDFGFVVVDDRVVDVARGTEVVAALGRVVVVVRSVVGVGRVGTMPFDDTGSGRTSR